VTQPRTGKGIEFSWRCDFEQNRRTIDELSWLGLDRPACGESGQRQHAQQCQRTQRPSKALRSFAPPDSRGRLSPQECWLHFISVAFRASAADIMPGHAHPSA
jgi:hypothetical protein